MTHPGANGNAMFHGLTAMFHLENTLFQKWDSSPSEISAQKQKIKFYFYWIIHFRLFADVPNGTKFAAMFHRVFFPDFLVAGPPIKFGRSK
jgi:hypothetical protein